jgi:hypothetical protein
MMRDQVSNVSAAAELQGLFKMKIAGNIVAAPVFITAVDGQQSDIRLQVP